ncbi:hypothetical protein CPB86DRAFT_379103 [Serendipita vermifera]|nr:hypothetical protein CPB86DRAFT_379103 [Serendipita vermifera]
MVSYNFVKTDPTPCAPGSSGHWKGEPTFRSHRNGTAGMNTINHPLFQENLGVTPSPSRTVTFLPIAHLDANPMPLHASSGSQPHLPFSPLFNDLAVPSTHSRAHTWNSPGHHSSLHASGFPATSTDYIANPTMKKTRMVSQKAKFTCPWPGCGKLYTNRTRASTCFYGHVGAKPFSCNGGCGIEGW